MANLQDILLEDVLELEENNDDPSQLRNEAMERLATADGESYSLGRRETLAAIIDYGRVPLNVLRLAISQNFNIGYIQLWEIYQNILGAMRDNVMISPRTMDFMREVGPAKYEALRVEISKSTGTVPAPAPIQGRANQGGIRHNIAPVQVIANPAADFDVRTALPGSVSKLSRNFPIWVAKLRAGLSNPAFWQAVRTNHDAAAAALLHLYRLTDLTPAEFNYELSLAAKVVAKDHNFHMPRLDPDGQIRFD